MRIKKKYLFVLNVVIAVIFAILFFKNHIGMNLLIFELITLPFMVYFNRPLKINLLTGTLFISTIITAVLTVLINTTWCIVINTCLFFLFNAAVSLKSMRSFLHLSWETFARFFMSQFRLLVRWHKPKSSPIVINFRKIFLFILLPLFLIALFIGLYAWANPIFYEKFSVVIDAVLDFLDKINFLFVLYLLIGMLVANAIFIPVNPMCLYKQDLNSTTDLQRKRNRVSFYHFRFNGLQTQLISAVIILVALNLLIGFFNYLDITHVWFNFEWDGRTLSKFVHEGTYVLLVTILLSAGIALYYFRKNLNFYKKNKLLKVLSVIWLLQNAVLTFSVVVRNLWYIQYFGLAYKRVALLFFLALVIFGLFTIILKILLRKNSYFLLMSNSFAVLLVFVISSFVNWNVVIAKYNTDNYDKIIFDLKFLSELDDSALPYILKTDAEIEKIEAAHLKNVRKNNYCYADFDYYYYDRIKSRKEEFMEEYPKRNILEWNLADKQVYDFFKNKE